MAITYEKLFVFLMTAPNNELKVKDCVINKNGTDYLVKKIYDDEGIFYAEADNMDTGEPEGFQLYDLPEKDIEEILKYIILEK